MKKAAYLLVYLLPVSVYIALTTTGWLTFLPVVVFFGLVPVLELLLPPDSRNPAKEALRHLKEDKYYDWVIYLTIPLHIGLLFYFFQVIATTPAGSLAYTGRILSVGLLCGVTGINLGHELGHRHNRVEQLLGELLLLTSLNTHFLPYHNAGHHVNVATPNDPATARRNQLLYAFWLTSHFGSYRQAWRLESQRLARKGGRAFSWQNRMLGYSVANVLLVAAIYYFFGLKVLVSFLLVATIGILLLETVNYIEHYGLLRQKNADGRYERVQHHHSWNSDHVLGRAVLFNLSRHSDHHYNASLKYQVLKSIPDSPQMPTGYPGMMLLALLQPLWFWVMNKKLIPFSHSAG